MLGLDTATCENESCLPSAILMPHSMLTIILYLLVLLHCLLPVSSVCTSVSVLTASLGAPSRAYQMRLVASSCCSE